MSDLGSCFVAMLMRFESFGGLVFCLGRTPAYSGKPITPFPLSNFRSDWSQGYRRLFQTSTKVSESSALARSWSTNAQADL